MLDSRGITIEQDSRVEVTGGPGIPGLGPITGHVLDFNVGVVNVRVIGHGDMEFFPEDLTVLQDA